MNEISYLYASDNNFAKVLGVSLLSLCIHNSKNIKNIFVISQNISDENKNKLENITRKFNKNIDFIEMPDFDKIIGEKTDIKRYSVSTFSRIIIDALLPKNIKKIIYLDCDTLINQDLTELWNYNLNGKAIGAVNDYRSIFYQRNLKIKDDNCYINAGILLIDLELYREKKYEEKLISIIKEFNGIFEFPDNDAICKVMQDDITLLPLKYNVSSVFFMTNVKELKILRKPNIIDTDELIEEAKKNPAIIHFTTCFLMKGRPWLKECNHPLVSKYYEIYLKTPWKNETLGKEKTNIRKKIKNLIVNIVPRKILIFFCGIVHAYLKPLFQKRKFNGAKKC